MTILADQTYRARFTPVGGDDGILCIPDGTGRIGNDGMGKIEISGANEARKYALTDSDGRLLAVMTGNSLAAAALKNCRPVTATMCMRWRKAQLLLLETY